MIAYCGRRQSASFRDRFPYIGPGFAREPIARVYIRPGCSIGDALATAIIGQPGST